MNGLYAWKEATAYHHVVTPEVAASEIERILAHGELTPTAVVDAARPPDAPLHPEFEWDDHEAAEQWRKEQARHLIAHIVVTYAHEDKSPLQVRAYSSISDIDGRVYVRTDAAMSEEDARTRLLATALRELDAMRKRYRDLNELASIFLAAEEVKQRLQLVEA